jgi:hypothetical protein
LTLYAGYNRPDQPRLTLGKPSVRKAITIYVRQSLSFLHIRNLISLAITPEGQYRIQFFTH